MKGGTDLDLFCTLQFLESIYLNKECECPLPGLWQHAHSGATTLVLSPSKPLKEKMLLLRLLRLLQVYKNEP